ncbi:hypothetical protein [Legionella septentrionalis]|uniref:Uncharacterized protein n=1 Tax=Legionella septentrionalis TaxID=2498109 RepID=A0A3S1CLA9_9GAMM|nr:hypothetical protein [Legionella septentrionalis]RUQ85429.1 hypothetical protein EKM59_06625 [Legionella septentrionalis]RUR08768.1 hypothetical protein ELY14_10745 [Legionella septentrionalis]
MSLLLGMQDIFIIGELKVIIILIDGQDLSIFLIQELNIFWRAAAYHATEAYSSQGDKWWVNGFHFY